MRDLSPFWLGPAGILHLNVTWRMPNDFDLASLSSWQALHPDTDPQSLRIASCPYLCDNVHSPHHPAAIEILQNLIQDDAGSLLYLHAGLAKECKSALLPSFVWQTGRYREVLGMAIDQPTPGWAEIQLAAAMAKEYGSCWLVLDAISRFATRPDEASSHLLYLHFRSEAATNETGGWRGELVERGADHPQSLTAWIASPAEGDVLLPPAHHAPPVTLKIHRVWDKAEQ